MNQETFHVEGMTCGHCEATVKRLVGNLQGVIGVEASHQKDTVTVTLDANGAATDRQSIAKTIDAAGFDVIDAAR